MNEPRKRFAAKPLATLRGQRHYFVDLSHTVEDIMITYKSLPAPLICDSCELKQCKMGLAVREKLIAIMTGEVPDPYAWVEAL